MQSRQGHPIQPKSKTPLFIGIAAAAAIGLGAFVMFGGSKKTPPTAVGDRSPPSKPASMASSTPKPAASSPPTPKPAAASTPSVSKSPPPPVPKSSEPQFPPGQWVKVFTKAEDLPESLRKPETGVKWKDGTVSATKVSQYLGLVPGTGILKNMALRGEISGSFTIRLRDNSMTNYYGFWQNTVDYYDRNIVNKPEARKVLRTFAPPSAHEVHSWEFAVIGTTLTARLDGKIVASVTDSQISSGMITFSNLVGSFKNLEVINLDGLSEAEALKILGVDEKGNDLRQPAAITSTTAGGTSAISNAAPAAFPPGQWVKVFTKLEDLPDGVRAADPELRVEDGKITPAKKMDIRMASLQARSLSLRATIEGGETQLDISQGSKGTYRAYVRPSAASVEVVRVQVGVGSRVLTQKKIPDLSLKASINPAIK